MNPSNTPRKHAAAMIIGPALFMTLGAQDGCPNLPEPALPEPAILPAIDLTAINVLGKTVASTISPEESAAARVAAAGEPVTGTLSVYLWSCADPDGASSVEPYVQEDVRVSDKPITLADTGEEGEYCVSVTLVSSTGEIYKTPDLLTDINGLPLTNPTLLPAPPQVTLSTDTQPNVTLYVYEQIDYTNEAEVHFDKNFILTLSPEDAALIASIPGAVPHLEISGCVSYGMTLQMSTSFNSTFTQVLGFANDDWLFLVYDESNPAQCKADLTITSGSTIIMSGSINFEAPPSDGIPHDIGTIDTFWLNDTQLSATFEKLGDLLNLGITLPQELLDYLDGYNQSAITYEIAFDEVGSAGPAVTTELTLDGQTLEGWVAPLDDAQYVVTLSILDDGQPITQAVAIIDMSGDFTLDFEFILRLTLTATTQPHANVYAYADVWQEEPVPGGIDVIAICADNSSSAKTTWTATTGAHAPDPHTGNFVARLTLPVGSTCALTYTYDDKVNPKLTASYPTQVIVNSLDSQVLDWVWLGRD